MPAANDPIYDALRSALAFTSRKSKPIAPADFSKACRAVMRPDGRPPPGATHWPTIKNLRKPGNVFGNRLKPVLGVGNHPSELPFQFRV
jgi:hypothetical protein